MSPPAGWLTAACFLIGEIAFLFFNMGDLVFSFFFSLDFDYLNLSFFSACSLLLSGEKLPLWCIVEPMLCTILRSRLGSPRIPIGFYPVSNRLFLTIFICFGSCRFPSFFFLVANLSTELLFWVLKAPEAASLICWASFEVSF